ncbi:MAG: 4Fe-4S binding protein [Desulfobacter sp.]|nr:MAG: 4Fe-4S binding protein [Desulfobacter sp.]
MAYTISNECIGCMACAKICPTNAVTGEKKQIHAIDPAACIECGACGRVCPSRAVLDHFGLAFERIPKKEWDCPQFDLKTCMSCTICLDTCPVSAISQALLLKGNPHLFPVLADEALCIGCGFCAGDCPADAVTMVPRNRESRTEETEKA